MSYSNVLLEESASRLSISWYVRLLGGYTSLPQGWGVLETILGSGVAVDFVCCAVRVGAADTAIVQLSTSRLLSKTSSAT